MPKHRKGGRGVVAKDMDNFQYKRPGGDSPGSFRRPFPASRHVDAVGLKRVFMLQNFQFVLRRDVQEMRAQAVLPQGQRRLVEALLSSDAAPPWDAVTAVVVRTTSAEFQCPICLEPPLMPRITDCGHTFCLPCMLQHLAVRRAEGRQRTCPVCQNFVAPSLLRPCVLREVEAPRVGAVASFTLLRRLGQSAILLRHDDAYWRADHSDAALPLPSYGDPSALFSRYVWSTASHEAALRQTDAEDAARALDRLAQSARPHTRADDDAARFLSAALDSVLRGGPSAPVPHAAASPPLAPHPGEAEACEMYAESGGQPFFLHAVTFKMIRHDAEGRGAPLPQTVRAPVEEILTLAQDESSRRHYRPFAHVPLHGTVKLCVLDLAQSVRAATLSAFAATTARMRAARRSKDDAGDAEDTSWRAYVRRYRADAADAPSPSPELAASEFSLGSERLPLLELPSPAGAGQSETGLSNDSSIETRQRATKKMEHPIPTCWTAENSRRLLATPPVRPTVPTWGGHVFNPKKSTQPSTTPCTKK